jgi:hypothetical protein
MVRGVNGFGSLTIRFFGKISTDNTEAGNNFRLVQPACTNDLFSDSEHHFFNRSEQSPFAKLWPAILCH